MNEVELLNARQAAAFCGYEGDKGVATFRRRAARRRIPVHRDGRSLRWTREDLRRMWQRDEPSSSDRFSRMEALAIAHARGEVMHG